MKVVLLKDTPGVGRKGEVKTVSDGHALNFLIPRKCAEMGTPAALARAERARSEAITESNIQANLLQKNLAALSGATVEIFGKANEQGHLFSGIHAAQIVAELNKQKGITLLPEHIELPHPIKETGEHEVSFAVREKAGKFMVVVKGVSA